MKGVEETSRSPAAMLVWPASRSLLIARLRRVAMFSGPCPVRILEASSREGGVPDVVERFSMTHCDLAIRPMNCGDAWRRSGR